jgi:hypothetical protein
LLHTFSIFQLVNGKRRNECKGVKFICSRLKGLVLFYRGAILREGLIVVQQGEKLAEYYGPPKDANHRSELLLGKNVNYINRRIKEPSIKIIFEKHF